MRSIHFAVWSLIAAGTCALRAQCPTPAASPTIGINTLDIVTRPDALYLTVTFTSLLDRNHPEDLGDSNVTILAGPSGSRLKPYMP
jgi:hypothetical protein